MFGLFALMAWSKNMRVQLGGLIGALILVNSSMLDRAVESGRAPHRELIPARVDEMKPAATRK